MVFYVDRRKKSAIRKPTHKFKSFTFVNLLNILENLRFSNSTIFTNCRLCCGSFTAAFFRGIQKQGAVPHCFLIFGIVLVIC